MTADCCFQSPSPASPPPAPTPMLNVIFTLDYEIHGNGDGCAYELMVEPTSRMMDLFERYGAKLTIMADVAEILKFKEYKELFGRDDYHYDAIAAQLQDAVRRGHDVQLHLHASYFNAQHQDGRWVQDWSEYNFAGLPLARMIELVRVGKAYLENLLQPVSPPYRCVAFRAANWSVTPSRNVVRALLANDIRIDTSVFKYGRREGLVNFDYANAPSDIVPWRASETNICVRDDRSELFEFPIYSENRWVGAFVTPQRIHRAWVGRLHRLPGTRSNGKDGSGPDSYPTGGSRRSAAGRNPLWLAKKHAWKADFNQCTGRQLVRALNRAANRHDSTARPLPFVLIGHSKSYTQVNARSLEPFLQYAARQPERYGFGVFGDFKLPPLADSARKTATTVVAM